MDEKYKIIGEIANLLANNNKKLYAGVLASLLNNLEIRNSNDKKYIEGGRGIYKTIKCACNEHRNCSDFRTADNIADCFIDKRKKPAWDK